MTLGQFMNSFKLTQDTYKSLYCSVVITREKVRSNGDMPVYVYLFSDDGFKYAYKGSTKQPYLDMMDKIKELYKKAGFKEPELIRNGTQLTLF